MVTAGLIAGLVLALPSLSAAAPAFLEPSTSLTWQDIVRRADAGAKASATVGGRGGTLRIVYSATSPVDLDLVPLHGTYSLDHEQLFVRLPAGENLDARVDLSHGMGWSAFRQTLVLRFSAPSRTDQIDILELTIEPATFSETIRATLQGFLHREQFAVSSPHSLRGQRIGGVPFTALVGIPVALVSVILFLKKKVQTSMLILVVGSLTYSLWFGWDLLRFTQSFAHAGSAEDIGSVLRHESTDQSFLFLCTNTGNYYSKAVRYFAYPVPVSRETADIPKATHVLVHEAHHWSYENGVLRCGSLDGNAVHVRDFPDGSVLFSASP